MAGLNKAPGGQSVVAVFGLGISLAAGVAIGLGQGRSLAVALLVLLALAAALVVTRAVALAPQRTGFWIFGAAVFAVSWNGIRIAESASLADLLLLFSLPFACYGLLTGFTRFRLPNWLVFGASLLVLVVLLMEILPADRLIAEAPGVRAIFSFQQSGGSNLGLGIRLLIALVVFPIVAVGIVRDWNQVRTLTNLWIAGITLSCFVAVLDAFAGTSIQTTLGSADLSQGAFGADSYGEIGPGVRYVGLMIHPVALSLSGAMIVPLILIRLSEQKKYWLYVPVLLVCSTAIFLSGSRTGMVLVAGAIVVLAIWMPKTRRLIVPGIVALVVIALTVQLMGDSLLPERFSSSDSSVRVSNARRADLLEAGVRNFINSPIRGYGFEQVRQAHNVPLQLLISGGIIALVGYLIVVFGYVREGLRLRKRAPESMRGYIDGIVLGFIVFLVASLFGNYVFDRYLYVPAALILGASYLEFRSKRS